MEWHIPKGSRFFARVLNPIMSTDAKGTVSGFTFGRGPGGPQVRRKPTPVRRLRTTQPANRSLLGWLSRQWGGLTDVQRQYWREYAVNNPQPDGFGGTFIMSGINAFVSLNHVAIRLDDAAAFQESPPTDEVPATIATFAAVTGVGNPGEVDLTITVTGTGEAADFVEFKVAGPFLSKGRVEVHSRYKFASSVAGNILVDTIADLNEGSWYWFQARYVDEFGQRTAWHVAQATPMLTP